MSRQKKFILMTFATMLTAVGIYFFKFPNNFTFGGVTGIAVIISKVLPISPSLASTIMNMLLLLMAFIFLGKEFGMKTAYSSVLLSICLAILEVVCPMDGPFTSQPILELAFAIALPAIGSALLFNIGASGGGMDIVAMMLKKYTRANIGLSLFMSDIVAAIATCFVFDMETGLFSFLGLSIKAFMVDGVIERINLCKYFTVICKDPEPICDYIVNDLGRSATTMEATGAFTGNKKHIILAVLNPHEALLLRTFVREKDPKAFVLISNTSEIIGRGFHSI